jgi:alpha-glucosidase (family GH31 glycosyl hydrolase)
MATQVMAKSRNDFSLSRRSMLESLGTMGAALLAPDAICGADGRLRIAGRDIEIQLTTVTPHTFRLTVQPIHDGKLVDLTDDGTLVRTSFGAPAAKFRGPVRAQTVKLGDLRVVLTSDPFAIVVKTAKGETVQKIRIDSETAVVSFATGNAPLLGLGEGGPQFDRRGNTERMISGSSGYNLRNFGSRVPIPWLIGTDGWAVYIRQPYGSFDCTGEPIQFHPAPALISGSRGAPPLPPPTDISTFALPIDLFMVVSSDPAVIMAEWERLTGRPELPPRWSFGYHQSHRTLAGRDAVLQEARTFREKKLPCDAMIYLGTGFCPAGWNTNNGDFTFNRKVMPDPQAIFDQLHRDHFKVVLHVAYPTGIREMKGAVGEVCDASRRSEQQASCYWDMHRPVLATGVDGWWPDEGDALDLPSRLVRHRMYWDAYQLDRPNERPYALHRNGAAGMARYASFLWSGDISSMWVTLKNQVPIGINSGLSGIPYWGTDIGGFVPTPELTGELYVRWFQFGAFCTLFRSHGRVWTLRLPWGWNQGAPTGDVAAETRFSIPEVEYHNAAVEPICRKYLELRYRMMPYLYSAVRECTQSGIPVMRALWLHYPGDAVAVARGDEYLWGRDILVAPVVEQGATERRLYLPSGTWYDFWTNEKHDGGREVTRKVDLETIPLYVRAGAIVPFGPVKQYTAEKVEGPLDITVYPGADGSFLLYEDDGGSFSYREGGWMGIQMTWTDARKVLTLRLAAGSQMMPPAEWEMRVKMGDVTKSAVFDGRKMDVRF